MVGALFQEDDITLYCSNEIGLEFKEISWTIRAREKFIFFEVLHDRLAEYEDLLKLSSRDNNLLEL